MTKVEEALKIVDDLPNGDYISNSAFLRMVDAITMEVISKGRTEDELYYADDGNAQCLRDSVQDEYNKVQDAVYNSLYKRLTDEAVEQ